LSIADGDVTPYVEPGDVHISSEVGACLTAVSAGQSNHEDVVTSTSTVGAPSEAQSTVGISVAAYVPLLQLVDHISPYTSVDAT